jgi:predicted nuclease of predicted toxin-antitoxin system
VKVLFDHGTPAPLRRELIGHEVTTAYERGWSALKNGELIAAAEAGNFEVLVTTDKNLKYQQNLSGRSLAIVVLWTTSWPKIQKSVPRVRAAVDQAAKGSYAELGPE